MNYAEAKALKIAADNAYIAAGEKLQQYPRQACGLVEDVVKKSAAFQADKAAFAKADAYAKKVNKWFLANFKKQYLAERQAKRMAA